MILSNTLISLAQADPHEAVGQRAGLWGCAYWQTDGLGSAEHGCDGVLRIVDACDAGAYVCLGMVSSGGSGLSFFLSSILEVGLGAVGW